MGIATWAISTGESITPTPSVGEICVMSFIWGCVDFKWSGPFTGTLEPPTQILFHLSFLTFFKHLRKNRNISELVGVYSSSLLYHMYRAYIVKVNLLFEISVIFVSVLFICLLVFNPNSMQNLRSFGRWSLWLHYLSELFFLFYWFCFILFLQLSSYVQTFMIATIVGQNDFFHFLFHCQHTLRWFVIGLLFMKVIECA